WKTNPTTPGAFSGETEDTSTVEAREAEDHRAPGALYIGGTDPRQEGRPEFSGPCPTYEMSERTRAVPYGGLAAAHPLGAASWVAKDDRFAARHLEASAPVPGLDPTTAGDFCRRFDEEAI